MKRVLLLTITSFSLMLSACQDISEDMIFPPPEFDIEGRYGVFIDTTIFAYSDSFLVNDRVNTKYQEKLLIGSYEGFSAAALINFTHLPDTSQRMDSVYFNLYPTSIFGTGSDPIQIGIYEVEMEWDESANTKDEWHDPADMRLITTVTVNADDSTRIDIPIEDQELLQRWQKAGDDNYGMYLKALNDPEFILEINAIGSVDANKWPRLMFKKWENDTTVELDSINLGLNISIYDYNRSGAENIYEAAQAKKDLLISSGVAAQSILRFDIKNTVPKNALIHKVNLTMYVNDNNIIDESAGNMLDNPNHAGNFYVRLIKDMKTLEIDSTFKENINYYTYLNQNEDVLELNNLEQQKFGRTVIQDFINNDLHFEGLYIQYRQEGLDVSVKRLYGINHPELKPSLHIQYFRIDHPGM